jgi:hypothetical protein
MPKKIDKTGMQFGSWTVLHRVAGPVWLCRCKCGVERAIGSGSLTSGTSTKCASCKSRTHGMDGTKVYYIWAGMKQRCQNQKYHSFKYYGGRGIKVCDEWQRFESFYKDMGDVPEGMSLGRIDNDGDYSPENCRWETAKQQIRNRSNTTYITHQGETKSLAEWAEKIGIAHGTLKRRYQMGWTGDKLLQPLRRFE